MTIRPYRPRSHSPRLPTNAIDNKIRECRSFLPDQVDPNPNKSPNSREKTKQVTFWIQTEQVIVINYVRGHGRFLGDEISTGAGAVRGQRGSELPGPVRWATSPRPQP